MKPARALLLPRGFLVQASFPPLSGGQPCRLEQDLNADIITIITVFVTTINGY